MVQSAFEGNIHHQSNGQTSPEKCNLFPSPRVWQNWAALVWFASLLSMLTQTPDIHSGQGLAGLLAGTETG